MSVESTPGSATADSYCTVAEADAYNAARLFATAWSAASTPTKEAALKMATRLLDQIFTRSMIEDGAYYGYSGQKVTLAWTGLPTTPETQALCWPRTGMLNRNSYAIASDVIPQDLKNATAELARQLIVADTSANNDVEAQGIQSLSAGPVSLAFREPWRSDNGAVNSIVQQVIARAAQLCLVPSWFITVASSNIFTVVGGSSR